MATVMMWELNDVTTTGSDPFPNGKDANATAVGASTFTISGGAVMTELQMTDTDPNFDDGDANGEQLLTNSVTVNGTPYGPGTEIENEYSYVVRPLGSTDPADNITIYLVDFNNGNVAGIASDAPLVPGVTYEIIAINTNNPTVAYSSLVVCFARGTLIGTPKGERRVETLREGDLVQTADNGASVLRWMARQVSVGFGSRAPIRFESGVLGNARPLLVSPQHRMLVTFRGEEVLLPAKALLDVEGVSRQQMPRVDYFHVLLDRHEVVFADGASAESLLPGPMLQRTLADSDWQAVAEIAGGKSRGACHYRPARSLLRPGEWRRNRGGSGYMLAASR